MNPLLPLTPAALLLLALPPALAHSAQPTTAPADAFSRAAAYDAALLAADGKTIFDAATPELRKLLGTPAKTAAFLKQSLGPQPKVDESETVLTLVRTVHDATGKGTTITYVITGDGTLAGLSLKPAAPDVEAPSPYLDYHAAATFAVPFTGQWTVAHGGRTLKTNYHTAYPDQRFAYDILIKRNGSTHTGTGKSNVDYYCFGKPVLSPTAATVLAAVDETPDNTPGQMNPAHAMGNYVILDCGHDEYLFLCHFKHGSVAVKQGDKVEPGTKLGLCGNSGNSSEPHLHIHLQDTPTPFRGKGKPLAFSHATVNGKPVPGPAEPERGQTLEPTRSSPPPAP